MQVEQLSVKVFAEARGAYDPEALIPVFHRWVRERLLPERLLIDVADYRHVDDGPGVLVVGDGCHFGIDEEGGLGLLYSRKRDALGPAAGKLREAFSDALSLCVRLEDEDTVPLQFLPGEVEVRVMSRRVARNTPEALQAFRVPLEPFLKELYGASPVSIGELQGSDEPFGARIRVTNPPPMRSVLGRFGDAVRDS